MGTYRAFRGTGSIRISCKGASWSDAMETLAQGVFSQMYNTSLVGFEREVSVRVQGEDLATLATEWISELLTLYRESEFVPGDFIVIEVGYPPVRRYGDTMMSLRATARGRMNGDWLKTFSPHLQMGPVELTRKRSIHLISAEFKELAS